MKRWRFSWRHRILMLTTLGCMATPVAAGQMDEARQCALESQRLKRLACFDGVFGTPLAAAESLSVSAAERPARWRQAYAQEQGRTPGDGPLYNNTGDQAGHLVTLAALGSQPPRPVLALQCHNNITELSLMLPDPLDEERVTIGFGAGQDLWRVRDNGYLLSGGRGLPAIQVAKALAARGDAEITSPNGSVDGLMFDLEGFRAAIEPLRSECGW
ncbi:type VI secretion system-associated protein VasI [Marinobacter sp.]|uniref:type VI secretion system-associated protein VasI n=1 Tax=Marinobacter sp. TaxID=50741 RepID=UPI0034A1A191